MELVAPRHDRDSIAPTLNQAGVGSRVLLGIAVSVAARPANKFRCACVGWRVRTVHDEGHGSLAVSRSRPPNERLPGGFNDLDYDQYRSIRFLPDRALWRSKNLPFEAQLFHRLLYKNRKNIFEITAMTSMFFYGPNDSNDIEDFHRWTTPTVLRVSWQGRKLLADSHQLARSPDQPFRISILAASD
jgi:glucan biosynthesis protein